MKCPKCESENTQRLEIAFHSGTQNISTISNSAGVGIGSGGRIGFGGGVTKTSGQSQSVLAAICAPPAKKSYKTSVIQTLIGAMFIFSGLPAFSSSAGVTSTEVIEILIGLAFIGAGGYFVYLKLKFNLQEWPRVYQHWRESWICHKCGCTYHQQ